MRWTWVLGLGAALGVLAAAVDYLAGGYGYSELWRFPAVLLNAGTTWAGLAVLCGFLVRRPLPGAAAGLLGLSTAVASYYVYGSVFGDRAGVDLGNLVRALGLWLVGGLVAGPLLGLAGALARRRGFLGVAAALVVPLGALTEVFVLRRLGPRFIEEDPVMGAALALMVVAALAGIVLVVRRAVTADSDAVAEDGVPAAAR